MDKFAMILAAGKGTRMKSERPKVLHELAGKPMLLHVLDNLEALELDERYVVVGFGADQVRAAIKTPVTFIEQKEQKGTGHAVLMARQYLQGREGVTLVGYGDMPLVRRESLEALMEAHLAGNAAATILTGLADNPHGYGRIIRENGTVVRIVEEKDATEAERAVQEVNTGIAVFDNRLLFEALADLTAGNAQGEYYLTDVIGILRAGGQQIAALQLEYFEESLGVNDRVQLAQAEALLRARINRRHMLAGVTLRDPATTYIGSDVQIGADTIIEGGVTLLGQTVIGRNCLITSGSRLTDAQLHSGVVVRQSTIESTTLERGSDCGPYAHLRPGSILHEEVHVGNFVEVKGSTLGRGTKAGHLTYIGDATVGEKVNFGAGTITVNYDGKSKYRTEIDDFAFVGSNSTLIAPIHIGRNALTAAGSTIVKDVADESVAIGRARQVDKLGHARDLPHYRGD